MQDHKCALVLYTSEKEAGCNEISDYVKPELGCVLPMRTDILVAYKGGTGDKIGNKRAHATIPELIFRNSLSLNQNVG